MYFVVVSQTIERSALKLLGMMLVSVFQSLLFLFSLLVSRNVQIQYRSTWAQTCDVKARCDDRKVLDENKSITDQTDIKDFLIKIPSRGDVTK